MGGVFFCVDCDLMLAGLLERFLDAAGMGTVKTGKFAFDVDNVLVTEEVKVGGGGNIKDEL